MIPETAKQDLKQPTPGAEGFNCPVCQTPDAEKLASSWKNYHDEKRFKISETEFFAECCQCGTLFRAPLRVYPNFKEYGEDYYNQVNPGETVEAHALWHFKSFQKPNYDALHRYMVSRVSSAEARRWLDVGSIGYATTLPDYEFHTIEPDERIVKLGRRLFRNKLAFWKRSKIKCATIESYQDSEPFDGVVFHNSFYCVTTPLESLKKAFELLRPGGTLLISISSYWNGAVAVRTDGQISRIEDVLQGETFWVFYNRYSLEYLCRQAGFELLEISEVPCYEKKTFIVYRFKKSAPAAAPTELLEKSREWMMRKSLECFKGFEDQTQRSLKLINHENYFVITTAPLLEDLSHLNALERVKGVVLFEPAGIVDKSPAFPLIKIEDLKRLVASKPSNDWKIAVLSFKYRDEIYAWVKQVLGESVKVLCPNRKSGMEQIFFNYASQRQFCKGLLFHV